MKNKYSFEDYNNLQLLYNVINYWLSIRQEFEEKLESCMDEDYYSLLQDSYNHLCASILITIYSKLETELFLIQNRLMKKTNIGKSSQVSYNYKCLDCCLKQRGIINNEIKNYNVVNILRLYCNAYKHNNGEYSNELLKQLKNPNIQSLFYSTNTGVNENNKIDYTDINVKYIYDKVCVYYKELLDSIKQFC